MLIDVHAHLDRYGEELESALTEITEHRILTIAVSMDLPSYQRSLEIADRSNLVLPTFGVHPKRAPEYAGRLRELSTFIEQSPMIGEIGLDFHWVKDRAQYPAQRRVLEYFLAAAKEQGKVVNLHTKGAEKEILDLLERYDIRRPVVHWYSGPMDIFHALIDYGAYFTVGVEVFSSENIQAVAREVPEGQLLTETDNPGGLKWLRGVIGLPLEIEKVVQVIAALRQSTAEAVTKIVHDNFMKLTADDLWLTDFRGRLRDSY